MRIETLANAPDRAGRYRLVLEDGTVMRLYRQTVEDFTLYPGLELSEDTLRQLRDAAGKMSAKMRAVRIVAASSVSKKDLEQRLVHKGETQEDAQNAVAWMEELSLIDDAKTAQQIVSHCIAKGYGIARARQALYEKRIPKAFWDDALADYPQQEEKIIAFLQARLDENSTPKDVKKAVDALLRRGHAYAQIRHALDQISFDCGDFPED